MCYLNILLQWTWLNSRLFIFSFMTINLYKKIINFFSFIITKISLTTPETQNLQNLQNQLVYCFAKAETCYILYLHHFCFQKIIITNFIHIPFLSENLILRSSPKISSYWFASFLFLPAALSQRFIPKV